MTERESGGRTPIPEAAEGKSIRGDIPGSRSVTILDRLEAAEKERMDKRDVIDVLLLNEMILRHAADLIAVARRAEFVDSAEEPDLYAALAPLLKEAE